MPKKSSEMTLRNYVARKKATLRMGICSDIDILPKAIQKYIHSRHAQIRTKGLLEVFGGFIEYVPAISC
jgi:hypothetical protein